MSLCLSVFNNRSSSVKNDFIAIISPYIFDSRDFNLPFREEYSVVRTRGVVFIPAIGVTGNDLFIDGVGNIIDITESIGL